MTRVASRTQRTTPYPTPGPGTLQSFILELILSIYSTYSRLPMKRSTRITLVLLVLIALLVVTGSTSALAQYCMGIGDVSTQCGCEGTASCSYP